MKVSTRRLAYKLKQYKVKTDYVAGWDSPRIDPYNGQSDFWGVMLHHTAGTNSLGWVTTGNPYAPVRACHFLVDRDGTVNVVSGVGAYHAGEGGPWRFPRRGRKDLVVPEDQGNRHFYGIEIESLGSSPRIGVSTKGMTLEQVISTAILSAALLNSMQRGWRSQVVSRVIRHRDWTSRKPDVKQDLDWWHEVIGIARKNRRKTVKTRNEITAFVKANPTGKIR